jgi:hypothetical protein
MHGKRNKRNSKSTHLMLAADLAHGRDEHGAIPERGVLPVQQQRHRSSHGLAVEEPALAPVFLQVCILARQVQNVSESKYLLKISSLCETKETI